MHDPLSAWYADFFTELPNTFWRAAVPPQVTMSEIDFLLRVTGLPPGSRVFDVACGSGRHTRELARRGFRVTGVDISAEAIEHLRRAAAAEDLAVDARVGDMRDLPADTRAELVLCMGNVFGYLEHEQTERFLADVAAVISPGGVLVLDYGFVAESVLTQALLEEPPMCYGGVEAISVNQYDPAHSRLITAFTFRRGKQEQRATSVQHVYTAAEVTRLVTAAGFADVELYGDTDGTAFQLGSPRLLLTARRAVPAGGRRPAAPSARDGTTAVRSEAAG